MFSKWLINVLSSVESADSQVRCKALIDFTEQNMYMWKKMTDLTSGSQARIQRLWPLILTDVSCEIWLVWSTVRLLYPDPTIIKCAQTVHTVCFGFWTQQSDQYGWPSSCQESITCECVCMHVCAYLLTVMVFPSRLFSTDSLCMKHTSQNDIFEEWISFSAFCVILPCVCACVLPFSAATVLEDLKMTSMSSWRNQTSILIQTEFKQPEQWQEKSPTASNMAASHS